MDSKQEIHRRRRGEEKLHVLERRTAKRNEEE